MTVIGPFNYQAIYESDVWNTFHALGSNYRSYLYQANRLEIWMRPPLGTELGDFFVEEEVMNPLIENGLVEKTENDLIDGSVIRYELTEAGRLFADDLSQLSSEESMKRLVSRVKPIKP
jgi:hypothetical protein